MTVEKFSGSFFINLTGLGTEPLALQSDAVPPALRSLALFVYEYIMCVHVSFVKEKYFKPQISLTALKGQVKIVFF